MDWTQIPRDFYSLPPEVICLTVPMLSHTLSEKDVDEWLARLRSNAMTAHLPDMPTSRPSDPHHRMNLPGIGHPYWLTARDHIFAGSTPPKVSQALSGPYREVDPDHCANFIHFFKLGCQPSSADPAYSIDWTQWKILQDSQLGLHIQLKVSHTRPDVFQDGTPITSTLTSFHGTREIALQSILTSGLKSSKLSHKVTGLWLNDCKYSAATWNCSIMDQAPFVFCEVKANPEYNRQNANIMQGQDTRRISELRPGMNLPSVAISFIYIGIPHPLRTQWRRNLFQSMITTFSYLRSLSLPHVTNSMVSETIWATQLFQLTAARVAYRETDGAMTERFGGHFTTIWTECIPISIAITRLLDALQTSSERNREIKLMKFHMCTIPLPIREVFLIYFPELRVWTKWDNLTRYDPSWATGTCSDVDQWFVQ